MDLVHSAICLSCLTTVAFFAEDFMITPLYWLKDNANIWLLMPAICALKESHFFIHLIVSKSRRHRRALSLPVIVISHNETFANGLCVPWPNIYLESEKVSGCSLMVTLALGVIPDCRCFYFEDCLASSLYGRSNSRSSV